MIFDTLTIAVSLLGIWWLLFGASAVVQADERGYEHSHYSIIIDTPVYVVLYECNDGLTSPDTTTLTDGIHTLSIIQGPCYEL